MKREPPEVRHLVATSELAFFAQPDLPDDPSLAIASLPSLPAEVADRKHERRLWIFPL